MSWHRYQKEESVDYSTFDTKEEYTDKELEAYSTALLREDQKENKNSGDTGILFEEHLQSRRRREVYTKAGVPDDAITSGLSKDGQMMYWRTHPEGRKVNSKQQRKDNGASFFR
jgi:hypothetical protein